MRRRHSLVVCRGGWLVAPRRLLLPPVCRRCRSLRSTAAHLFQFDNYVFVPLLAGKDAIFLWPGAVPRRMPRFLSHGFATVTWCGDILFFILSIFFLFFKFF